jgi:hypothetical protein
MAEKRAKGKAEGEAKAGAQTRDERLAQALRENLKRRKAQSRERADSPARPGRNSAET